MSNIIHTLSNIIIGRRQNGFPLGDDTAFCADSDAETADLQALAKQPAHSLADLSAKARAIQATPFCTNKMIDAPAPGELELLDSLMNDLRAI